MAVRWQLVPVGIPPVLFGAEDLVDANDDVVTVHPVASVDLEHLKICHARRTAIGGDSIEYPGPGLSQTHFAARIHVRIDEDDGPLMPEAERRTGLTALCFRPAMTTIEMIAALRCRDCSKCVDGRI